MTFLKEMSFLPTSRNITLVEAYKVFDDVYYFVNQISKAMQKLRYAVLIDDDNATNVYHDIIVQEAGVVEKYQIFDCALSALEFLKKQEQAPDLILLDINMPKMTGWEFLEAYKEIDQANKPPKIIMLTTSLGSFDKKQAEHNPIVSEFRQKPLTPEMLEDIAESFQ